MEKHTSIERVPPHPKSSTMAGMGITNLKLSAFPCPCPCLGPSPSTSILSMRPFPVSSRGPRFPKIFAFSSNDIKVGSNIEVDGSPWMVPEFLHVKPGKVAAYVRTTLRNYVTGNTVDKTFRAGNKIEETDIFKETKQFTYKDGSQLVFIDLTTYEEFRLNEADVGDKTKWLKEGMDCNLLFWKGKVIDFELPITVKLTVVDVDPGIRGDTAQELPMESGEQTFPHSGNISFYTELQIQKRPVSRIICSLMNLSCCQELKNKRKCMTLELEDACLICGE